MSVLSFYISQPIPAGGGGVGGGPLAQQWSVGSAEKCKTNRSRIAGSSEVKAPVLETLHLSPPGGLLGPWL